MRDVANVERFTYEWEEDGLYLTIETDEDDPFTLCCNSVEAQAEIAKLGKDIQSYHYEMNTARAEYDRASDQERASVLGASFHDGLPLDDPKSEGYAERIADNADHSRKAARENQ